MKAYILEAVMSHYTAEDKALANIKIHINNPVGVGEHPKIVEDVIDLVHKASEATRCNGDVNIAIVNNEKDQLTFRSFRCRADTHKRRISRKRFVSMLVIFSSFTRCYETKKDKDLLFLV